MRTLSVLGGLTLLAACQPSVQVSTPAPAPAAVVMTSTITSADQLIAAMRDRYAGKWYRNLTFVQTSTFLTASAPRSETWYEAGAIPGRLRIDLGDLSAGNAVIYRGDSVYSIQSGKVAQRRAGRNPLMILGFDVYAQSPSVTMQHLRAERIDLNILRTDSLYGHKVYVVGAGPTDSVSNQFWVDADRMLFVRLIQSDTARRRTQDIRFEKYVQHDGGWVAEDVKIFQGGRMVFHEEYANVRVNVPLDEALFDPDKWTAAKHWYKP